MSTIWRGRHNWCTFRQEVRLQSVTVFDNQLAGKEGLLQTRQVHHRLFPHWSGRPGELASYWPRGIQRLQIRPPGGDRDDNLRLWVPLPLLLLWRDCQERRHRPACCKHSDASLSTQVEWTMAFRRAAYYRPILVIRIFDMQWMALIKYLEFGTELLRQQNYHQPQNQLLHQYKYYSTWNLPHHLQIILRVASVWAR